jgi:hypothetical protein
MTTAPPATPITSDLAGLAQLISTIKQAITPGDSTSPSTPMAKSTTPAISPPSTHNEGDLTRFLNYAEKKLGVKEASKYEYNL